MVGVISLTCLILGIVATVFGVIARKKAGLIMDTPTSQIGTIQTPGFYEINGRIDCMNPVFLPNWDIPCVWFTYKVEAKEAYTDREGHRQTRWHTLDNQTRSAQFQVVDESGSITVNPQGADLDGTSKDYNGTQSSGLMGSLLGGHESLGQRVTSAYLEVGSSAYVLGKVAGSGGNLSFVSGGAAYIISNRSEEQVLAGEETTYSMAIGGGIISLLVS